jgi:UDP-3-O-[3-hydroxymyristoyl] glucosamine N-acyltransferase
MNFSAEQIATFLNGEIEGDSSISVSNISKIEEGQPGTLTFLSNPKYTHYIYTTNSSIVLVNKDFIADKPISATLIRVENSYECLARLLELVASTKKQKEGIENNAYADPSAILGKNIYLGSFCYVGAESIIGDNSKIYPQVYVGNNVKIGADCIIYPGVVIYDDCIIGDRCVFQAGCIIGGDGFGFAPKKSGEYDKIAQIGNVVIEDDVEIGANTTVDRATMGSTIIHKGVKLDNLIQVAHNCEIGDNTVIAAQTGMAGSAKIGNNCMIGGQAGIIGHIKIGDNVILAARAAAGHDLNDTNTHYMSFIPAMPSRLFGRIHAVFKRLPDLDMEVYKLRKELDELKKNNK